MGNSFIMAGGNNPALILKASRHPTPLGIPVTISPPSPYTIISIETFDLRDYSKD